MTARSHKGPEWEPHYRRKRAHHQVFYALKDGRLVRPSECQECGKPDRVKEYRWEQSIIEAHHPSYHEPLNVMWLCNTCHKAEHKRMEEAGISADEPPPKHTSH